MADSVPGFAGFWYDAQGTLVVGLTAGGSSESARSALLSGAGGILEDGPSRLRTDLSGGIQGTTVAFSFRELVDLKRRLYREADLSGVVFVDIDERANAIRVGVGSDTDAQRIRDRLAAMGAPADAFLVAGRNAFRRHQELDDRFRPVPAGVRIVRATGCTLGVNVDVTGEPHFVTAAHCSERYGDGADYSWVTQDGDTVGRELYDPDLYEPGTGDCPNTTVIPGITGCRYSDASLFGYQADSFPELGLIARTTGLGSTTVSSSTPRFLIEDVYLMYPAVGTTVNMMGQKSGWSADTIGYGRLNPPQSGNTCVDVFDEGILTKCQALAPYESDDGDSGAPVFTWDESGSYVTLVGIHIGRFTAGTYAGFAAFSPWLYVSLEVEALTDGWTVTY